MPSTWDEPLDRNYKPACQKQSTVMWSMGLEPILSEQRRSEYVNTEYYDRAKVLEMYGKLVERMAETRTTPGDGPMPGAAAGV